MWEYGFLPSQTNIKYPYIRTPYTYTHTCKLQIPYKSKETCMYINTLKAPQTSISSTYLCRLPPPLLRLTGHRAQKGTALRTDKSRPPPQDVPLWHVDYFKLKAMETCQLTRNFYLSLNLSLGPYP